MTTAEFLERVAKALFSERISQEKAAAYLGITQPMLSRKLRGKTPLTFDDAERLKTLLGWDAPSTEEPALPGDYTVSVVHSVLDGLPPQDRDECCKMLKWVIIGKRERLSIEGQKAFEVLEVLV